MGLREKSPGAETSGRFHSTALSLFFFFFGIFMTFCLYPFFTGNPKNLSTFKYIPEYQSSLLAHHIKDPALPLP